MVYKRRALTDFGLVFRIFVSVLDLLTVSIMPIFKHLKNKLGVILLAFLLNKIKVESLEHKYSLETRFIEVPLDHFAPSTGSQTFKLRYLINAKYHLKEGPVFVYTGNEGDISIFAQNTGFMFDIAPTFNALLVFIEHRYYGQSLPFGNASFASHENMR